MRPLIYKPLWLMMGYAMVAFIIYSSLTTSPISSGIEVSDKLLHFVGYFGLMGWFIQIYQQRRTQLMLATGFIGMGVILEFLQGLGGVRHFEVNDMLANSSGVLVAWLLVKTPLTDVLFFFERKIIKVS